MFEVIREFKDADGKVYKAGSYYSKPLSSSRHEVLTTKNNKYGTVFLKEINFPRHIGGGWYELSNGERIRGRVKSGIAEANLG